MRPHFAVGLIGLFSLLTGCGTVEAVSAAQAQGTPGPAGAPGLIYTGPYNALTPYVATDVVYYQGSSYVALAATSGVVPIGGVNSTTLWGHLADQGATGAAGSQGLQGPLGAQGPSGAQGIPGVQGPTGAAGSSGAQGVAGKNMVSYLQGMNWLNNGDSFSSLFGNEWQNIVSQRTGMSLTVQDARPGRSMETALECWGNPALGGLPGRFNASYVFPSVGGNCTGYSNTGLTDGMTFASSLANIDLVVIDLGTNDQSFPIGQRGDATTSGTIYGNMRWLKETYENARPGIRVVFVTPQYNAFALPSQTETVVNAMVDFGKSQGIPVINEFALGGVNSNTAPTLTRDGTHPSDLGFTKFYGPVIAQGIMQAN